MHSATILAATALAGAAFAEQHFVAVGSKTGNQLIFNPDSVQAAQGDTVTFRFWPKNHSVAQATFAKPCQPMNNGFWSGYVPTTSTEAVANETFTYTVTNASAPVWFYCTQGEHCQNGMVGVINPPQSGEKTLAAFKNASSKATTAAPDSVAGTGGNLTTNGTATSGSPSSSSSSSSSSSASPPAQKTGAASQLSGSVAFAGLTGLFTYLLF